jgi:hypothetical protein
LLKYITQVTGSPFTSWLHLMAFISFIGSATPVHLVTFRGFEADVTCTLLMSSTFRTWWVTKLSDHGKHVLFTLLPILHRVGYGFQKGQVFLYARFYIFFILSHSLVMCSVSPTHLKMTYNPSLTLSRNIFVAM